MSDDDKKTNDNASTSKKKRKPPEKRPMKTRPASKKLSPKAPGPAAEKQASADLGKTLTPDALKAMFVDALHKSGLGTDGSDTATPEQLATALPEMLKTITANLGEQMRDALLPQLAAAQNMSAEDLEALRQALAEKDSSEEGEEKEKEPPRPEQPDVPQPGASAPGTPSTPTSDAPLPPNEPDDTTDTNDTTNEIGHKVRQAIDEYVAANASTTDAEGNPTARVDGEFLREHAGQMLSNALGALVQAFVPAAEQLGQRLADTATPPRQGEAPKKKSAAAADQAAPDKKKVNYEIDFAGLVGSVLSGMRKTQSQRRRPRKVAEPAPEPPTDVTGAPHGDAAEIAEAVDEAEKVAPEKTATPDRDSDDA